jgi:hypothetical protein
MHSFGSSGSDAITMSPKEWPGRLVIASKSDRGVAAHREPLTCWSFGVARCCLAALDSIERVVGELEFLDLRVSPHLRGECDLDPVDVGVELPQLIDDAARNAPRLFDLHIHAEHHKDDGVIAVAMAYRRKARPGLPRLPSACLHLKELLADSDIPSRLDERAAGATIMARDHLFRDIANRAVVRSNHAAVIEQLKALRPHLKQFAIRERAEIEQRRYVRKPGRAARKTRGRTPRGKSAGLLLSARLGRRGKRTVANAIARSEAAKGRKAIVRTAAAGRSRLGGSESEPPGLAQANAQAEDRSPSRACWRSDAGLAAVPQQVSKQGSRVLPHILMAAVGGHQPYGG